MLRDRKVSTDIVLILIVTFDQGNHYRMRQKSQRLVKHIQFPGLATILDIQITVRVIDKGNSNK